MAHVHLDKDCHPGWVEWIEVRKVALVDLTLVSYLINFFFENDAKIMYNIFLTLQNGSHTAHTYISHRIGAAAPNGKRESQIFT